MKKILLVLAVLASAQFVNAQNSKGAADAAAKVEKAKAAIEKKADDPAKWLALGDALIKSYDAASNNILAGMDATQRKLVLNNVTPSKTEKVDLGGVEYTKESYSNTDFYIDANGALAMVVVTKFPVPGALESAQEALKKANEIDVKHKNTDKIKAALVELSDKFTTEASNAYYLGDYKKSSETFVKVAQTRAIAPLSEIDTLSIFNAGLAACFGEDFATAKELFTKCKDYGYYGSNGSVFMRLADIAQREGRDDDVIAILKEGYNALPTNTDLLLLLIQEYLNSGKDTDELFAMIDKAVAANPTSGYPLYAKGQAYEKIGDGEKAIEAYRQCQAADPTYEWGYLGEGIFYHKLADKLAEQAQNEMDNKKYNELVDQWEASLKSAVPALEKAYEIVPEGSDVKKGVAALLKDVCFRLRNVDAKYQELADKYSNLM